MDDEVETDERVVELDKRLELEITKSMYQYMSLWWTHKPSLNLPVVELALGMSEEKLEGMEVEVTSVLDVNDRTA
jgi:hypothetical protein